MMRMGQFLHKLENLLQQPHIREGIMDSLTKMFTGLEEKLPEDVLTEDFKEMYDKSKEKNQNLWWQMWRYAVKQFGLEK